jgi:hypothetical protein
MPFVSSREKILQLNFSGALAQGHNAFDCPVNFLLPAMRFGHDAGNGLPVPGDDERLAALDVVEQARQMRLGFGRLNFAHGKNPRISWSNQLISLLDAEQKVNGSFQDLR